MGRPATPVKERFWSKVDIQGPDDCWIWKGAHTKGGDQRGAFDYHEDGTPCTTGSTIAASRVAYILFYGVRLGRWDFVCHTCDNGDCCNPAHLYLGTPYKNTQDMIDRGRKYNQNGERSHRAKLTAKQVIKIRQKYIPYIYSQFRLAKEYNVSRTTIQMIVNKTNWKSIL